MAITCGDWCGLAQKKMKMSNSYRKLQLEKEIRDKEKLCRNLIPYKSEEDKRAFKKTQKEIKELMNEKSKLKK